MYCCWGRRAWPYGGAVCRSKLVMQRVLHLSVQPSLQRVSGLHCACHRQSSPEAKIGAACWSSCVVNIWGLEGFS